MVNTCTAEVPRGVIQGDIISPILFILAMEQLFLTHDPLPTGTRVGKYLHVGVLGYAGDATIVSISADSLSQRLTSISAGSKADADMNINIEKRKRYTTKARRNSICRQLSA